MKRLNLIGVNDFQVLCRVVRAHFTSKAIIKVGNGSRHSKDKSGSDEDHHLDQVRVLDPHLDAVVTL